MLPAATWYEKHDLNTTDMHPFVHAFNPAIAPPWQTRTDFDAFQGIAKEFSELAATHLGVRKDLVAVPLLHDTPDETGQPARVVRDWKAGECERCPAGPCRSSSSWSATTAPSREKMAALGPLLEKLGTTTKGVTVDRPREVDYLRPQRRGPRRRGRRPPVARDRRRLPARRSSPCPAPPTAGWPPRASSPGEAHRQRLADLAAEHEGKRITFADTQARPVPVITSPEWSGSETGGRRYSPFTINVERLKPWHTLTGRQHFFLDHDWMTELGRALPVFRPPLDMTALFGEPRLGERRARADGAVPDPAHRSGRSTRVPGQPVHAVAVARRADDLDERRRTPRRSASRTTTGSRRSTATASWSARAIVTHRMPEGTVYMYHAQDRLIDVPRTETSGKRGGIHNSLTRLLIKPTHLIGGYAQLSFAFNYLGPTGNQRDEVTVIRRRSQRWRRAEY